MTTLTTYTTDNVVRLSALFEDDAGTDLDPSAVFLVVQTPAGVETTYTYGTDVELVKDSVGHYHFDQATDQAGIYLYRWYSTGTGAASERGSLWVQHSEV